MEKETFTIKPISYLAGFHLHKPNFNLKDIKGELYNFISDKTNKVFTLYPLDENIEIGRVKGDKNFELRFESLSLIYQDGGIEYNEFKDNALSILEKWQALYKPSNKLRVAGIVRSLLISNEAPKGSYNARIYDHYLNNFNISGKKKSISLHLNYGYNKKGLDYNINLNLDEVLLQEYSYQLKIDINKIDSDKLMDINFTKVKEIFTFAEKYYNEEFFHDINLSIK